MPPKSARGEPKADDEYVSLAQVMELLQQQKEMYTALLNQQQDNFKSFVKVIMDSTNLRLDSLTREMQDIKTSLQFTQKEVDDIKVFNGKQDEYNRELRSDVYKTCDSLMIITDKMDYLEAQSRRNNLVFEGLKETDGESWSDTELKVKDVLKEKLQIQQDVEIERAHRVGRSTGRGPRPVVVKFMRHKDKSSILQRAKMLKGSNIYINEDFTESVRRKRKELMPKLREARARGDIAFLRYDKLVVHSRTSTPKQGADNE